MSHLFPFPSNLEHLADFSIDELIAWFEQHQNDIVGVFDALFNHATWLESHLEDVGHLISWVTKQSILNTLPKSTFISIRNNLCKHFHLLSSVIPLNLKVQLKTSMESVNSLLFIYASEELHELAYKQVIGQEFSHENPLVLSFAELSLEDFRSIKLFTETGDVEDLWKKWEVELLSLLKQGIIWGLPRLVELCADSFVKYISYDNIFDLLHLSFVEEIIPLKQKCIDYINRQNWGFSLFMPSGERVNCEIQQISIQLDLVLQKIKSSMTDLKCADSVIDDPRLISIIKECPQLIGINLSETKYYSDRLSYYLSEIRELNLSNCPWLCYGVIKQIIDHCPKLQELVLDNNHHLDALSFGELVHSHHLIKLKLANCTQIKDTEMIVIMKACRNLVELSLSHCKSIGELGFDEIAKNGHDLESLDLSYTNIPESSVFKMTKECHFLKFLNLSGCPYVSEKTNKFI